MLAGGIYVRLLSARLDISLSVLEGYPVPRFALHPIEASDARVLVFSGAGVGT